MTGIIELYLLTQDTYTSTGGVAVLSRIRDYAILTKFRLSALVVLSALSGFLLAPGSWSAMNCLFLCVGGFLVTAASNGLNQVIERDTDRLMDRTRNRPLARGSIAPWEGVVVSLIMGCAGLVMLWQINFLSAMLGFLALFIYVAIYTPLKKNTPWAVFVGAFPGAIPPMLGWVAATGEFGLIPGMLFFIQFVWQFPHFWAVAWVADDDYKKAGFRLLPSSQGRSKASSFQIMIYSLLLIPVSLTPWIFNSEIAAFNGLGDLTVFIVGASGLIFYQLAYKLHLTNKMKDARVLMFASFAYLPIVQFTYVFDVIY